MAADCRAQHRLVRDEKLFRLRIQLLDMAGMLGQICTEIVQGGGNIKRVVHDRTFLAPDAKSARVEVEIEVDDPDAQLGITERLSAAGFVIEPK